MIHIYKIACIVLMFDITKLSLHNIRHLGVPLKASLALHFHQLSACSLWCFIIHWLQLSDTSFTESSSPQYPNIFQCIQLVGHCNFGIYRKYILLNQMTKIYFSYIFGLCPQFLAHSF